MGNVWYNEPNTELLHLMLWEILSWWCTAARQYGGFTVPEVDKILGPYAQKSYDKYINEFLKYADENWNGEEKTILNMRWIKVRRDFD